MGDYCSRGHSLSHYSNISWPVFAQVLFGTADGQVIVMDCHGRMLAHVLLHESDGIVSMSWNCPDFLVEDSTESDTDTDDNILPIGNTSSPTKIKKCHMTRNSLRRKIK